VTTRRGKERESTRGEERGDGGEEREREREKERKRSHCDAEEPIFWAA